MIKGNPLILWTKRENFGIMLDIITDPLSIQVCGFSGIASNGDYTATAFRLMDNMWRIVKSTGLPNRGLNIWVYDSDQRIFAGVEPEGLVSPESGLEVLHIQLEKYARYKHIGPYQLIREAGQRFRNELKQLGYETSWPYIEIYGHWQKEESLLETDLIFTL